MRCWLGFVWIDRSRFRFSVVVVAALGPFPSVSLEAALAAKIPPLSTALVVDDG
jgi:hypothetical protein